LRLEIGQIGWVNPEFRVWFAGKLVIFGNRRQVRGTWQGLWGLSREWMGMGQADLSLCWLVLSQKG